MNKFVFEDEISRLKHIYGDRHYPDERCQMIWDEFKNCSPDEFKSVIREVIGTCATPPLLNKLRETLYSRREQNSAIYKTQEDAYLGSLPDCDFCHKRGYILTTDSSGVPTAFRCTCQFGSIKFGRVAAWDNRAGYQKVDLGSKDDDKVSIQPDEQKVLIGQITNRINGKMSDQNWEKFKILLNNLSCG